MKIGIFSGSFNPIHVGHLILANYIVEYTDIEEVWLLVSPLNPLKSVDELSDKYVRLEMTGFGRLSQNKGERLRIRSTQTIIYDQYAGCFESKVPRA